MPSKEYGSLQDQQAWSASSELPPNVFGVLRRRVKAVYPVAMLATTDADGGPHTAFFGVIAASPRLLRLGCDRRHQTFANLGRDNRAMIAFISPPDIAVSIRVRAKVVKEQMDLLSTDAVIEMEVGEVKNDMLRGMAFESGVSYRLPESAMKLLDAYVSELENF